MSNPLKFKFSFRGSVYAEDTYADADDTEGTPNRPASLRKETDASRHAWQMILGSQFRDSEWMSWPIAAERTVWWPRSFPRKRWCRKSMCRRISMCGTFSTDMAACRNTGGQIRDIKSQPPRTHYWPLWRLRYTHIPIVTICNLFFFFFFLSPFPYWYKQQRIKCMSARHCTCMADRGLLGVYAWFTSIMSRLFISLRPSRRLFRGCATAWAVAWSSMMRRSRVAKSQLGPASWWLDDENEI